MFLVVIGFDINTSYSRIIFWIDAQVFFADYIWKLMNVPQKILEMLKSRFVFLQILKCNHSGILPEAAKIQQV